MNKTLICLLIATLGSVTLAQAPGPFDHTKFIEDSKCLAKEKLAFADVLEFTMQDKIELAEKNPKLKCFASCLLEHAKLLDGCKLIPLADKSDSVTGEKKDEFVKIMNICKDMVKGPDRCDCGYQLIKCLTENANKSK